MSETKKESAAETKAPGQAPAAETTEPEPVVQNKLEIPGLGGLKNLASLMKGISDFSPIVITGFMFMNTVFNYDLKALLWFAPLLFWLGLLRFLQSKINNNLVENKECSQVWGKYKSPSLASFFIMYTLAYIATPMPIYDDWNIIAVLMFVVLFILDSTVRYNQKCASKAGIAIGGISGLLIGVFMYFAMSWVGLSKFLYYTTGDTNNVYCSKPKEQNFKCYVYKNGNIISTI